LLKLIETFMREKMPKRPKLSVVERIANNQAEPPTHLGETGASLWRSVMSEYRVDDVGGAEALLQVCTTADQAAEYRQIIKRDGPVVQTKNGPREHPLVKAELACRSFVIRGLQRLGLSDNSRPVGRPGYGGVGWIPPR
jgi:phage terminase small subunit